MHSVLALLKTRGYRDTQSRRLVLDALSHMKKPASPYDIQKWIKKRDAAISPVTVYRITELLRGLGIVHRHPCSGQLSLCAHPGKTGAHGYLHCSDCGTSTEFCSDEVSQLTEKQAKRLGFSKTSPLLEIIGICSACNGS